MEAGAGGGHKHTATHADAEAPSSPALTQQSTSSSLSFFFLQSPCPTLPRTNIHPDPHYCEPEDTRALLAASANFPETLLPLVLCSLYICPLLLFPSLLLLFLLPLPSFPITSQDSSPTPFSALSGCSDWLTMSLQVNAGNEAKGRACSDPKREGQFTLSEVAGYRHACLRKQVQATAKILLFLSI